MKTMKLLRLLSIGLITILFSCNSEKAKSFKESDTVTTEVRTARKYVDDNTFIDIDVNGLDHELATANSENKIDTDKVAKMKAALYRFYSHVNLVNGIYVCDLCSANDINVSSDVFNALMHNLCDMNEAIAKAQKEGKEIHVSKINQDYLNNLLK